MIYLISEINDVSTNKVAEWLDYYKVQFKRINTSKDIFEMSIKIDINTNNFNLGKNIFWIRRGYFSFINKSLTSDIYYEYLKSEYLSINHFIEHFSKNVVGSYFKELNNNKIENLMFAKQSGLKIPKTIITNKKEDLFNYFNNNEKLITKSISKPPYMEKNGTVYFGGGTQLVDLNKIPNNFSMSLIQQYVDKLFEIRVFFIKDLFFSMAIFSQNDEKTKVDFRNYNHANPNRVVPFNLPKSILKKLKKFAIISNHDTGSIDLIHSKDNKYYFLEINPMGQFDWLSGNCNYYIEKNIAELLIKLHNEKNTTN